MTATVTPAAAAVPGARFSRRVFGASSSIDAICEAGDALRALRTVADLMAPTHGEIDFTLVQRDDLARLLDICCDAVAGRLDAALAMQRRH